MESEGLAYRTIRIRARAEKVPYFVGSQIRGALGYALKETVCVNPSFRCDGCFARENCLYHDWFEAGSIYHPYCLDFELGKPYYDVGICLFGDATEKLPYVVSALHRMLTKNGLGVQRKKIEEFQLHIDGKSAYEEGRFFLPKETPRRLHILPRSAPQRLKLSLITPLRLKYRNRFVRKVEELHLPTMIGSAYRRYVTLAAGDAAVGRLPFRVDGEIVESYGTFEDLTRYSSRQKGRLKIGGVRGEVVIEGIDANSYAHLKAAEIIGMGKQTVFGLGKVKVDIL
jgi:hypothetical protein